MKVYIQTNARNMPYNINTYAAMLGFEQMGIETKLFYSKEELKEIAVENIVVGGVGTVRGFLENRNIFIEDIDYPNSLQEYYGREIWESTVKELLAGNVEKTIFVKPKQGKQFNGFVYRTSKDLIGRVSAKQNVEIYCSEVLEIEAEWRCFVRYNKILDIKQYKGSLGKIYDLSKVERMIESFQKAPKGYGLDIGLTKKGETVIVEVNDGYSLGSYGLDPLLYAKLLSARWAEMTHTEDECNF